MNPDQPSRERIEPRLTALLLGELPADEAALLRYTIAQDPALQQLHDELQATLVLVREAAKHPADAPLEKAALLRLSAERRQRLLEHFKTGRMKTTAKPEPLSGTKTTAKTGPLFWLKRIEVPTANTLAMSALVILFVAVLAAISIPNFVKARATSQSKAVVNNLRQIDAAKNEWALENKKSANDVPTPNDLSPYLKNGIPQPVMGETYALGKVSEQVVADVGDGQRLDESGATVTLPRGGAVGASRGQYGAHGMIESLSEHAGRIWSAGKESPPAMPASPAAPPPATVMTLANSAPAPQIVTLAPKPKLAPPPVAAPSAQIVLPQPEAALEIAAESGTPAQAKKSEVYSQSIVGYVNVNGSSSLPPPAPPMVAPPNAQLPADTLALNDSDGRQPVALRQANVKSDKKQWIVPGQAAESSASSGGKDNGDNQYVGRILGPINAFANRGFGGGTGGGGGGGASAGNRNGTFSRLSAQHSLSDRALITEEGERNGLNRSGSYNGYFAPSLANSDTLALSDNSVNRLQAQTHPVLPLAPNAYASSQAASPPAPAAAPLGQFPSAAPGEVAGERPKHQNGTQARSEHVEKDWVVTKSTPTFAFDTSEVKRKSGDNSLGLSGENVLAGGTTISSGTLQSGESDREQNVTVFKMKNGNTEQAAQVLQNMFPSGSKSSQSGSSQNSALMTRAQNSATTATHSTSDMLTSGGGNNTFSPGASAIEPETIDMKEALDRYGKLTGRKMLYGALPSEGKITLPKSLPREAEKQALQGALVLNGVSLVNMGDSFVKVIPNTDAGAAGGEIDRSTAPATTLDSRQIQATDSQGIEGESNQPYFEAKRDLDQKLGMHQLLASKLEAEKLDLSLPKNSLVQLTDPAQPGHSENIWQRLTGEVESKARIKIESDVTDIPGMASQPRVASFDPYFIQTTFETMQSEAVLGKVVDALNLQSAWAGKNSGEKLNRSQAIERLKQQLELHPVKNTKLIEIAARSNNPKEAADIANAVAKAYADYRAESRGQLTDAGYRMLQEQYVQQKREIRLAQEEVGRLSARANPEPAPAQTDLPLRKPAPNAPLPQPEILTRSNAFSTFSLNVSDVSFKFAEASLQNGRLPDTAAIRSEEFINAFDYRDPEAAEGQPMAFTSERARYPFAHNRELLRFAVKTAAAERPAGRALNLVLLLDNSGSMERADRVAIIHEALRVLAAQLQPQDTVSVVTFARTARLWADGIRGDQAGATLDHVGGITPEGGTNLEEAMRLAYQTARRHYLAGGMNRVVLLTDGAANLGNVEPAALKRTVEAQRKQGIALDCFGIGWEDYNDDLLEQLSSNGDGRYAFLNSPEDTSKEFAAKLAGALQIAAADVKVQVEFNPARVISYRQIGYATHQLTKEQFRDNSVAAGQIAAQEAGNALYTIETNPNGDGPIATVHVRYKVPGTSDYREHSWDVAYTGGVPALAQSSPAMRLAATASAFSEWLAASPYAQEVTLDDLLQDLRGVPEIYGADDRPKQLETMIREAKSLEGK